MRANEVAHLSDFMEINMVAARSQYLSGVHRMATTPWDQFIGAIEKRKQQLDELLASYRDFREKLAALPPEIAQEAQRLLVAETDDSQEGQESGEKEFAGKSALECAKLILKRSRNRAIHYSAIAKKSMNRGYRGRVEGSPEEVETRTISSFWAALHRSSEFEGVGKGRYRLVNPDED